MSEGHDDDLPRDAWLREALRHAPDAEATPPPKLNETILRMGRAAVAPREERKPVSVQHASPSLPSGTVAAGGITDTLAALWAWLARPPVAAGLAVVFLSTVVGVMWMGRPAEEPSAPREEMAAATPPAAPAAVPKTEAPVERGRVGPGLPEAAKRAADSSPPAVATAPAARKAEAPPVLAKVEPMPAAPPAPAAAAAPAANDMAAREVASAERREATARSQVAAAPGAAAPAASAIETPSLSNLRFEIRRKAEAWSWQRDEGEARAMDDPMQNWIALADRSSRPAWREGAAPGTPVTTTLRFTRDGVVRAILRLGPAGMQLTRGGKTESAMLSAGQVAALQSALDALGP